MIDFEEKKERSLFLRIFIFIFVFLFLIIPITLFFSYFFISGPDEKFPVNKVFEIKKGMNIDEIADFLERENYIKSAFLFKIYSKYKKITEGNLESIKAGRYVFDNELDTFGVYERLSKGISGIKDIKIRILEGDPNFVIADRFEKKGFKNFNKNKFLELAKDKEGYLYPDTYSFSPYVSEAIIIETMEKNFIKKTEKLIDEIERSNKSLDKIIIMASLIEKEANGYPLEIKRRISGVLWKRLEIDMPLQVDAVFSYIYKRHLYRTLYKDLEIDSPYNTYKYKGLPPGPIGNPSIESIEAALRPIFTGDLYYITGKDKKFYFAKTGEEHYQNIYKYRTNYQEEKENDLEKIEE